MAILLRSPDGDKSSPVENGGPFRPERILEQTAHRPYSLPAGPWIMTQRWHHLLFAHWPLAPEQLRPLLPPPLQPYLETFDGTAWLGVIPFWMSHVRPRWMPPVPGASRFAELNVRTYVNVNGIPGVYFFSLDAESRLAVQAARTSYHLNYRYARMRVMLEADGTVGYSSQRMERPAAELECSYTPQGDAAEPEKGSLEDFLTGRYCLYACRGNASFRANIHHLPWRLRPCRAHIVKNTMAAACGATLPPVAPLLHYSESMDVLIWLPKRL